MLARKVYETSAALLVFGEKIRRPHRATLAFDIVSQQDIRAERKDKYCHDYRFGSKIGINNSFFWVYQRRDRFVRPQSMLMRGRYIHTQAPSKAPPKG